MAVFSTNLTIHTDTDFEQTFVLENSNSNSALDLTGYTGACRIRRYHSSSLAGSFSVSFPNRLTGKVKIEMASNLTKDLKAGKYFYDLLLNNGTTVERVIEGEVLVKRTVTRP